MYSNSLLEKLNITFKNYYGGPIIVGYVSKNGKGYGSTYSEGE